MDGAVKMVIAGVTLLIVVAFISALIIIFSTSKNTANDGVVQLQSTISALNDSVYDDYDQKIVSGIQVKSAYNQMNGNPVAIIVKTCKGDWVDYNAIISPFSTTTKTQSAAPFTGLTKDATTKQYTSSVSSFDKTSAGTETSLVLSNAADSAKQTVLYNTVITEMSKNGATNYISPTAKFNSYLVKDAGDSVIGIVFIQQGKHTSGT